MHFTSSHLGKLAQNHNVQAIRSPISVQLPASQISRFQALRLKCVPPELEVSKYLTIKSAGPLRANPSPIPTTFSNSPQNCKDAFRRKCPPSLRDHLSLPRRPSTLSHRASPQRSPSPRNPATILPVNAKSIPRMRSRKPRHPPVLRIDIQR